MELPYFQRGARINLKTKTVRVESLDRSVYENFLGGKGIGALLLFNLVPPLTDPLSPENKIIFLSGPLTGSSFPSSSRGVIVTKSPLTGAFLDSNIGGYFGRSLKATGFDYIIIEDTSETPVWIFISDQGIEFNDAEKMWGLSTSETGTAIRKQLKDDKTEILTIGPAGENLVRFASIRCGDRMFGRGGAGAVMGAKRLKAVALMGSREQPWFTLPSFREAVKKARKKISSNDLTKKGGTFPTYGTSFTAAVVNEAGVLPSFKFG